MDETQNNLPLPIDNSDEPIKKVRRPNRSKEEIAAEKALKEAKRQENRRKNKRGKS